MWVGQGIVVWTHQDKDTTESDQMFICMCGVHRVQKLATSWKSSEVCFVRPEVPPACLGRLSFLWLCWFSNWKRVKQNWNRGLRWRETSLEQQQLPLQWDGGSGAGSHHQGCNMVSGTLWEGIVWYAMRLGYCVFYGDHLHFIKSYLTMAILYLLHTQGESSSSWNPSSYLCTFPTMINGNLRGNHHHFSSLLFLQSLSWHHITLVFQLGVKPGQSALEPTLTSPLGSFRLTFDIHLRKLIMTRLWFGWSLGWKMGCQV